MKISDKIRRNRKLNLILKGIRSNLVTFIWVHYFCQIFATWLSASENLGGHLIVSQIPKTFFDSLRELGETQVASLILDHGELPHVLDLAVHLVHFGG